MKFFESLVGSYRRYKTGLTRHITILLINFGIIPLAGLFLILHLTLLNQSRKITEENYQGLTLIYAQRLRAAIEQKEKKFELLAQLLTGEAGNYQGLSEKLTVFRRSQPQCQGLYYYHLDGSRLLVEGSSTLIPEAAGKLQQSPGWQAARAGRPWSQASPNPDDSSLNLVTFVPVFGVEHAVDAILVGVWDLKPIWEPLEQSLRISFKNYYLLDDKGRLIFHNGILSFASQTGQGSPPLLAALQHGVPALAGHYQSLAGEKVIGAGAVISPIRWYLVVEDPLKANKLYSSKFSVVFLIVYCLTIIMALVLGKVFSDRKIIKPLRQLREQITEITGLPFETWNHQNLNNEIEALSKALAAVQAELQRTMVSRDLLAQEVAEREKVEEALRRSEATLANILRTVPLGLGAISAWQLVWANDNLAQLTGFSLAELLQHDLRSLFLSHYDYHKFVNKVEVGLHRGQVLEFEVTWGTKDGQQREILLRCAQSGSEAPSSFIFTAMDITTRKRLEAESLKLSKLESLGILAGGLAHDFNNILTVVLGHLELLHLEAKNEPQILRRLVHIEEASLRARNLARQLLTFAKGGSPLKKVIALADFLPNAVSLVLSGSKCAARLSIAEELWPVAIDPDQIQQALNNILLNAEQAMPEGGFIEVRAQNRLVSALDPLPLAPGRYVQISIADKGVGIAPEHLAKIFDPYFTTKEHGTGLGLTTTFSIIKNHKGHIAVESEVGQGTTFHLYLPAAEETAEVPTGKVTELPLRGGGRILVLDDEKEIREVLKQMLHKLGYEPICVSDGKDALALYREALESGRPFAAVILDLTVPGGMGGEATLKALQQLDPQVRAIVSSGYSDNPIMSCYKDYGFQGVIAKPYKISDLGRILGALLSPPPAESEGPELKKSAG